MGLVGLSPLRIALVARNQPYLILPLGNGKQRSAVGIQRLQLLQRLRRGALGGVGAQYLCNQSATRRVAAIGTGQVALACGLGHRLQLAEKVHF